MTCRRQCHLTATSLSYCVNASCVTYSLAHNSFQTTLLFFEVHYVLGLLILWQPHAVVSIVCYWVVHLSVRDSYLLNHIVIGGCKNTNKYLFLAMHPKYLGTLIDAQISVCLMFLWSGFLRSTMYFPHDEICHIKVSSFACTLTNSMHFHNCHYLLFVWRIRLTDWLTLGKLPFLKRVLVTASPELTLAANCDPWGKIYNRVCVSWHIMRAHVWIFPTPEHIGVSTNCCTSPFC